MKKIIQFIYHLFCFAFLFYLVSLRELSMPIKSVLLIIAGVHLYDCWWFYKYDIDAFI